jgi:hypothetical protein
MTSLDIYTFTCAPNFVIWLNQQKPRKLIINEQKWIHKYIKAIKNVDIYVSAHDAFLA